MLLNPHSLLRNTVQKVRKRHPFRMDAWVVLPEHLHCIWTLPPDNSNFSLRWRLIKSGFSRVLPKTERRSKVRQAAGERGIWQRHFWEHAIRDDMGTIQKSTSIEESLILPIFYQKECKNTFLQALKRQKLVFVLLHKRNSMIKSLHNPFVRQGFLPFQTLII